jgi:hypothetical protein
MIAFLIGRLANYDQEASDSYVRDLIDICSRKEENSYVNSAMAYIYSVTKVSEGAKQEISDFVRPGMLPETVIIRDASMTSFDVGLLGIGSKVREINDSIIESFRPVVASIQRNLADLIDLVDQPSRSFSAFADLVVKQNLDQNRRNLEHSAECWKTVSQERKAEHWAVDPTLDSQGRNMRQRKNLRFSDHLNASAKRNKGGSDEPVLFNLPFPFGSDFVVEDSETHFFETEAHQMALSFLYAGIFQISNRIISFDAQHRLNLANGQSGRVSELREIEIDDIIFVLKRRHLHRDDSCEIFTLAGISYFFTFPAKIRDHFFGLLKQFGILIQTGSPLDVLKDHGVWARWKEGDISNYEYLLWLNLSSGRSFNDISQYPIFPWVLTNYKSDEFDLHNSSCYRNLSASLGLLNTDRYEVVKQFYAANSDPNRSHYQTYYQTGLSVANFLVRTEPFTSISIDYQNGQFEIPERLFRSIPETWESVLTVYPDFRELTPEFYSNSSFLVNSNGFDLGMEGGHVELPLWAKSPSEFIYLHRSALESPLVSRQLNDWVDMIFGYKSRGPASLSCSNDFHKYNYPECLEHEELTVDIADIAYNMGVVPDHIFTEPSPKKKVDGGLSFVRAVAIESLSTVANATDVRAISATECLVLNSSSELFLVDSHSATKVELTERNVDYFENNFMLEVLPDQKLFAIASPITNNVRVIGLDQDPAPVVFSGLQTGAARQIVLGGTKIFGTNRTRVTICSLSHDNSFVIWRTTNSFQRTTRLLSSFHTGSIIEIAVSAALDLAVAITDEPALVFTNLENGSLQRTFPLDEEPRHVKITRNYVVVCFKGKFSGGKRTRIDVYEMNGACVISKLFDGRLTLMDVAELDFVDDVIVVCFSDKTMVVMKVFGLVEVTQCQLLGKPVSMSIGQGNTVFVLLKGDTLHLMKICHKRDV